jgi:hypothetical protein
MEDAMTTSESHNLRLLSVQPVSRGFAFAVLEGPSHLIDYGVVQLKTYGHEECLRKVAKLVTRSEPSLILIEDLHHPTRRSARATMLLEGIEELARKEKIGRKRSTAARRGAVRMTKHQVATKVAERFPELGPRLPAKRRAWMSEDARMGMFVACAAALTYFSNEL